MDEDDCTVCGRVSDNCECLQPDGYPRHLTRPVHWHGRQWAVTGFGIEGLGKHNYYNIGRGQLSWKSGNWADHMAEKNWVDMDDFKTALAEAERVWPAK